LSWPLASFAIVLGVLAAGWLAYERSRPSARMVAVVGTLAALAALGRDAFAALPDVKPITAMTFVVGYALGPLPGFTVGAIGMLASNLVLGEGPYTPWQMAAWGTVGLAGAALGRLSGRRLSRLGMALACMGCAIGAKETMNVYEWTLGASHTPAAFLLVASKGLPFDVTDALASFLFGLAFGPELARLLARVRVRMTVTWEAAAPLLVLMLLVSLAGPDRAHASRPGWHAPAQASSSADPARAQARRRARSALALAQARSPASALARTFAFLERAQNGDGGFGGAVGQRSGELYSAWAALGIAAAGRDPASVRRQGHSVLDAIRREAATLQGAGDLERTILALHACGAAPRLAGQGDLVARLLRFRAPDGSFERLVNVTSFAVLALRAGGRSAEDPAVRAAGAWLAAQQAPDGGFSYAARPPAGPGGAPDVDDTAAALQALIAAGGDAGGGGYGAGDHRAAGGGGAAGGQSRTVAHRAVSYLLAAANRDGGLPQQPGRESNAQSTAWAAQALLASAERGDRAVGAALHSALAYLRGLIAPDGSVRYSRASAQTPVWVTAQALAALAGRPLPIAPAGRPLPIPPSGRSWQASSPLPLSPSPGPRAARSGAGGLVRAVSRPSGQGTGAVARTGGPSAAALRAGLDAIARAAGTLIGIAVDALGHPPRRARAPRQRGPA
jgi:energy-coupling factor transport system substrate-specific component